MAEHPEFARPRRKPLSSRERQALAGAVLADTEFMSFIQPRLEKNSVALLGADPSRVTQMQDRTNIFGSYIMPADAEAAAKQGITQFERQHLEAIKKHRPGLESDVVMLRAAGNPMEDKGVTVIHEFAHRGFDMLRQRGQVPPADEVQVTVYAVGLKWGLDEEDVVHALDYYSGSDKEGAVAYFTRIWDFKEELIRKFLSSSDLRERLEQLMAEAQRERVRRRVQSRRDG